MAATATAKKSATKNRPVKAPETDDELIARALSHHGWPRWEVNGITDEELFNEICLRLSQALVFGPRQYAVDHRVGAIWFDQSNTVGVPSVEGDELVSAARRVFRLPQPQQLVEQFTQGKVRHAMEPKPTGTKSRGAAAAAAGLLILETVEIPIAKMVRSPFQTRSEASVEWIGEVAESLRKNKQTTPCLGRWVGENFELIAGHTRWIAAKSLKWTTLRCEVSTADDATAALIVFEENAKRRELTVIDKAKGLQLLVEEYVKANKTRAQCAADALVSESYLSNTVGLLRLPVDFQDRVAFKHFSIEQGRSLVRYVDRPAVFEKFREELDDLDCSSGPVTAGLFDDALLGAIDATSRSMDVLTALYKPSKAELTELDIEEIKRNGKAQKRAFNIALFDQLWNKAGQADEEAEDDEETSEPEQTAATIPRDAFSFGHRLRRTWCMTWWAAVRVHLKGKLKQPDKLSLARAALWCYDEESPLATDAASLLAMSPAEYHDHMCQMAMAQLAAEPEGSNWETGPLSASQFAALGESLGLDPSPHFVLTAHELCMFGDADLAKLAKQMKVDVKGLDRSERISRLADGQWPRDGIPAICDLDSIK